MRRVVVTGMGIVSSIGNNTQEVLASLREAKSGISRADAYAELGFRCQVHGAPTLDPSQSVDRRAMRFLGRGAAWNHVAMEQALRDAGLEENEISNERTGIIMGSGGPSTRALVEAADATRAKGPKRVGPFAVPKAMSSTASATLATWFKIKGVNYSISSACATSNHCIGNAAEIIQLGKQDMIFAGGCEDLDWTMSVLFDAMGAMSSKFNDTPEKASRAYDAARDGFVIAGGAGVLVLEELEHAKARAQGSMPKSPATAPLRTATTWSRRQVKARCGACGWRSRPSRRRLTTSIPTPPRHRSAMPGRSKRCVRCSGRNVRRSRPPNR